MAHIWLSFKFSKPIKKKMFPAFIPMIVIVIMPYHRIDVSFMHKRDLSLYIQLDLHGYICV